MRCSRSRGTRPGAGWIPRIWCRRRICGPSRPSAGTGDVRAWLAAICLNAARSESRRRRRRPQEAVSQALLDVLPFGRADGRDQAPDVADLVIASLDAQEVSRCLALLPEQQRLSIVLMDVAGYTARETAEVLGCPRGTVLARVHRGWRRLAQLLAEAGVSHGQP